MTYSEIKNDINAIAKAFNLGLVVNVETKKSDVDGFNVAIFSTQKETGLKYFYKT